MMIVVAIVGMIAGITYPAVASGLESIHLSSASDTGWIVSAMSLLALVYVSQKRKRSHLPQHP